MALPRARILCQRLPSLGFTVVYPMVFRVRARGDALWHGAEAVGDADEHPRYADRAKIESLFRRMSGNGRNDVDHSKTSESDPQSREAT